VSATIFETVSPQLGQPLGPTIDPVVDAHQSEPAGAPVQASRPSLAHGTDVAFSLVRTRAGFDSLEADWNALFDRSGRSEHMFLTFNWLWHWANHYLDQKTEIAVITGHRHGSLVLVWPLVVERPAGLRQLAFMGAPVSQYGDVLIDAMPDRYVVLDAAWTFMAASLKADLVRLAKVRDDATLAPLLAAKGFRVTAQEEAPFATLSSAATYAAFDARFSPKLRKNRRRQLRRLEERGSIQIENLSSGQAARDAVSYAMTLKRAWLNQRGLVSKAFSDKRIDAFFADAVGSIDRPCGVAVSQLRTAGECADLSISITCKGRQAIHILTYALKFEKFGAGNHHLEVALERAFDTGIGIYDFLAPRHAYKMEWADGTIMVSDHALSLSPLGRIYTDIYLAKIRETLKRRLAQLPLGMRRLIGGARRTTASF
jgi:CelD/BcsL family acetyltransferase involved in cellulose biosynthesis